MTSERGEFRHPPLLRISQDARGTARCPPGQRDDRRSFESRPPTVAGAAPAIDAGESVRRN